MRGTCYKQLANYLSNRSQVCKVNDIISTPLNTNYGVPQGSTLGPLLFIIFINGLTSNISNIHISPYADDTSFYFSHTDPTKLWHNLSKASSEFQNWCMDNRLTLNQSKCKTTLFAPKTS